MKKILALLIGLLLLVPAALADRGPGDKQNLDKTTKLNDFTYFTINNIFSMYGNTGLGAVNLVTTQTSGFEYPKGSNKFAIYEDGFVYGGYFRSTGPAPSPRKFINGTTHRSGFTEGGIRIPGTGVDAVASGGNAVADTASAASMRVYRVRPDINPYDTRFTRADYETKLQNEEVLLIQRFQSYTAAQLYDKYKADWDEWPWQRGAPWKDVDGDGVYNPAKDIPGIPGADQTLWHLTNDMNVTNSQKFSGTLPVGIEIQRTIWGYNRQGALGTTLFMRYRFINKSGAPLDTMYTMLWSDPDLGYAGDDYVGCDTTRSLGFVYNGKGYDQEYGDAVPASGYTFFQGPLVSTGDPNDIGIFDMNYRPGYKNLKMTAFNMFINGGGIYTDPGFYPTTATKDLVDRWWHLLTGFQGNSGDVWLDPNKTETKFVLAGDPVKGSGWLDGSFWPPDDRRLCMCTGPFFLQPMDTQEVVVSAMVGQGTDRISSVTALRAVSDEAQAAFNLLFDLPKMPAAPPVVATPIDGGVILTWGDPGYIQRTEVEYTSKGYKFEGYKVFQTPTLSFTDAKTVGVFDLIDPVLDNNGVQHRMTITDDAIKSKVMINGSPYYFGVSAVAFNPNGVPPMLEAAPSIFQVVPHVANPGTVYSSAVGDVLTVTHTGPGLGSVTATVIDPALTTGHTYKVEVTGTTAAKTWGIRDVTAGTLLASGLTNLGPTVSGVGTDNSYPIAGGVEVNLLDVGNGIADAATSWTGGAEWLNGNGGFTGDGDAVYHGAILPGVGGSNYFGNYQSTFPVGSSFPFEMRFSTTTTQGAYRLYRSGPGTTYRVQTPNSFPQVPFTVWDVSVTPNRQLTVAWRDQNKDGAWALPAGGGTGTEFILIYDLPYDPTGSQFTPADEPVYNRPVAYLAYFSLTATSTMNQSAATLKVGLGLRLSSLDSFTFTSPGAASYSADQAVADANMINVYPNPYFAFNTLEVTRYERFVTFTHMPATATLRIIDISGTVIRTLRKTDPSQFFRWDLKNEDGFPVSSGIYVVYIDMPDLGKTKIVKVAVVQPQQILDRY